MAPLADNTYVLLERHRFSGSNVLDPLSTASTKSRHSIGRAVLQISFLSATQPLIQTLYFNRSHSISKKGGITVGSASAPPLKSRRKTFISCFLWSWSTWPFTLNGIEKKLSTYNNSCIERFLLWSISCFITKCTSGELKCPSNF